MASKSIDERLIPIKQYATPTTGATVTVNPNGYVVLILNPAGSLLALTITLSASPSDGDRVGISCSQAVTTVTMNGGTIIGALTTASIATFATYVYNSDSTSWYRIS